MANKENDGLLPMHVFHELVEHTPGGFVLFYFNSKDGSPEIITTFDSPAHCLGLQKHIADWSEAVQDISVQIQKHFIVQNSQPETPEGTANKEN